MTTLYIAEIPGNASDINFRALLSPEIIKNDTSRISNKSYLVSHLTALSVLTVALREYLDIENFTLPKLSKNQNGKPYLEGDYPKFNWSHSGNMLLLGVSSKEIGVDIEEIRNRKLLPIAQRFFSPEETEYIQSDKNKEKEHFFELWVIREALGKYYGTGIQAFSSIKVDPVMKEITFNEEQINCSIWSGTYKNYKIAVALEDETVTVNEIILNSKTFTKKVLKEVLHTY